MQKSRGSKVGRETRRSQIVQATLEVIAQRGVKALTTAAIAKKIGISEANLYRHFKNKDEILSETVEVIAQGLKDNVEKALARGGSPLEKLREVFLLQIEYIEKKQGIPKLIFSEEVHVGSKELGLKLLKTIHQYLDRLESLIREGQEADVISREIDSKAFSLMLVGMVQVSTFLWSLGGSSFPLKPVGEELWESFERCIKK